MRAIGIIVLLCTWATAGIPAALAQTGKYPERPIRLIVSWLPGGTVDVNARILGPAMSKTIGQQVVVDNRSGAFVAWFVLAAPKGNPREIILTLNEHFRKAMTFPDTIRRYQAEGLEVVGSTPEQAAATMESELKKYANLIRERGMKAE